MIRDSLLVLEAINNRAMEQLDFLGFNSISKVPIQDVGV